LRVSSRKSLGHPGGTDHRTRRDRIRAPQLGRAHDRRALPPLPRRSRLASAFQRLRLGRWCRRLHRPGVPSAHSRDGRRVTSGVAATGADGWVRSWRPGRASLHAEPAPQTRRIAWPRTATRDLALSRPAGFRLPSRAPLRLASDKNRWCWLVSGTPAPGPYRALRVPK